MDKSALQLRTSDQDIALLKDVFAGNDELLRLIRNLFLGIELEESEKIQIRAIPPEIKKILIRRFTGEFDKYTPVGQTNDEWAGVDITGKSPEFIAQAIKAREEFIQLSKRALELLDNPDKKLPEIKYHSSLLERDPWGIGFLARNSFLQQVDGQLLLIKVIVGTKEETVEEAKKRLQRDSTK